MAYTTEYEHIWLHDANDFYAVQGFITHCDGDSKTATIEHGAEE